MDLVQADGEPPLAALLTTVCSLVSPAFLASQRGFGGTTNPRVSPSASWALNVEGGTF